MRTRRGRIDDDGRTDCRLCGWRVRTDAEGRCPLGHRVGVVTVLAAPEPARVAEPVLVGAAVGGRGPVTSELAPLRSEPAWEAEAAAALDDLGGGATAPLPPFSAALAEPSQVDEAVAEPSDDDDPFAMFDDLGGWVPAPFAAEGDAGAGAGEAEALPATDEPPSVELLAPLAPVDEPAAAEPLPSLDEPAAAEPLPSFEEPAAAEPPPSFDEPAAGALGATAPLPPPQQVDALRTAAALAGVDVRDPLAAFVLSDPDLQPTSALDVIDVGDMGVTPTTPTPIPAPADAGLPFLAEDEPARAPRWIVWSAGGLGLLAGAGLVVAAVVVAPL